MGCPGSVMSCPLLLLASKPVEIAEFSATQNTKRMEPASKDQIQRRLIEIIIVYALFRLLG